jgi:N-acetylglutamate synthase-like GNAT family acetyltransferase
LLIGLKLLVQYTRDAPLHCIESPVSNEPVAEICYERGMLPPKGTTAEQGAAANMTCTVRPARTSDAEDISRVIVRALRETNSKDYSPEIIARVERSFEPGAIRTLIDSRTMFIAEIEGRIVGTASLDKAVARTVFVAPDVQRLGVGKSLMAAVMVAARARGIDVLSVPSSVTAERFYARLGFKAVRDAFHGDERTIIMECALAV